MGNGRVGCVLKRGDSMETGNPAVGQIEAKQYVHSDFERSHRCVSPKSLLRVLVFHQVFKNKQENTVKLPSVEGKNKTGN